MTDKKSINDELDRDSHPEPTAAVSRTGQERILFVFFQGIWYLRHFGSDAYGLILNVIETFVAALK